MIAYVDIPSAQSWTEYDEDAEKFYGMQARELELRTAMLRRQYRSSDRK